MNNNKTMERQNAAKTVGQLFQGQGPLTDEEEEQFKELIEDVAEFNKIGRFKERQSSGQEQQLQKVEIELSTDDNRENPEDTDEEDTEE